MKPLSRISSWDPTRISIGIHYLESLVGSHSHSYGSQAVAAAVGVAVAGNPEVEKNPKKQKKNIVVATFIVQKKLKKPKKQL